MRWTPLSEINIKESQILQILIQQKWNYHTKETYIDTKHNSNFNNTNILKSDMNYNKLII